MRGEGLGREKAALSTFKCSVHLGRRFNHIDLDLGLLSFNNSLSSLGLRSSSLRTVALDEVSKLSQRLLHALHQPGIFVLHGQGLSG